MIGLVVLRFYFASGLSLTGFNFKNYTLIKPYWTKNWAVLYPLSNQRIKDSYKVLKAASHRLNL